MGKRNEVTDDQMRTTMASVMANALAITLIEIGVIKGEDLLSRIQIIAKGAADAGDATMAGAAINLINLVKVVGSDKAR